MTDTQRTPEQILADMPCGVFLKRSQWREILMDLRGGVVRYWDENSPEVSAIREALGEKDEDDGA